ncbi:hypothetical protein GTP23_12850 [Pseudoduganella sp. FT93W]|uniref:Uncharacterized protein n=1 Tax=Duganella fentianensis TaxID=2692177 RepID=A0A845I1I3_9BURK|nr:hypothetical protein [Duganella fentianensis]MYN45937.1 hypothetical protein [Duganella fentianensis]
MKPLQPPSANLTASQIRIAELFGAMDDRRQAELMTFAILTVLDHPRRKKPTFRLIAGGAK